MPEYLIHLRYPEFPFLVLQLGFKERTESMQGFAVRLRELPPHSSKCSLRNTTLVALWAKSFNFFGLFSLAKRRLLDSTS